MGQIDALAFPQGRRAPWCQLPPLSRLHCYLPVHWQSQVPLSLLHSGLGRIPPRLILLSVQQPVGPGHVIQVGRCGGEAVHQARIRIHPYMDFHPEVVLITLLHLTHFRSPLPLPGLGGGGRFSAKTVDDLSAMGVDSFSAPVQTRRGRAAPSAHRGRIPKHLSPRDRMRRNLRTKPRRRSYARRMETVQPVFGQIKQGRGFRQFLLRSLEKVNREWLLICTGRNLIKLFRFGAGCLAKCRARVPPLNNKESPRL